MAYIPAGWTNEVAEAGDYTTEATVQVYSTDGGWQTLSDEYIEQIEWIYETDVSGRTVPLDEMDVSLSNASGVFDTDNPESLLPYVQPNTYIKASLRLHKVDDHLWSAYSDGTWTDVKSKDWASVFSETPTYDFPMGQWLISELSYEENSLRLVCYSLLQPLQNAYDDLSTTEDYLRDYLNHIKSIASSYGVPMSIGTGATGVKRKDITPALSLNVITYQTYGLTSTSLLGAGKYCFANELTSVNVCGGLTLTWGSIYLTYQGTPTQAETYEYVPYFRKEDLAKGVVEVIGYIEICTDYPNKSETEPAEKWTMIGPYPSGTRPIFTHYYFADGSQESTTVLPGYAVSIIWGTVTRIMSISPTDTDHPLYGYYYVSLYNASGAYQGDLQLLVGYAGISVQMMTEADGYQNQSVCDQIHLLTKTVLEGYKLINERTGGYYLAPSNIEYFAGEYTTRVIEQPQPLTSSEQMANKVDVGYLDNTSSSVTYGQMISKTFKQSKTTASVQVESMTVGIKEAGQSNGDVSTVISNEVWADMLAGQLFSSGLSYPSFFCQLIMAPEIEPKDLIMVHGRYGVNPYYVKKVTMTYDGSLISDIEMLKIGSKTWTTIKGTTWEKLRGYSDNSTWAEVLTSYYEFV